MSGLPRVGAERDPDALGRYSLRTPGTPAGTPRDATAKLQRRTTLDEEERPSLVVGQCRHELRDHEDRDVLLQPLEHDTLTLGRLG